MVNERARKEAPARARRPLADRVYHTLFTRIANDEYPVNQRLPSEHQLAEARLAAE